MNNKMMSLEEIENMEKAIESKYGPEAVQDFASGPFTDEKKDELHKEIKKANKKKAKKSKDIELVETDGVLIQKNLINKNGEDRICSKCKIFSFDRRDDYFMNKYSVCYNCYYSEDRISNKQK